MDDRVQAKHVEFRVDETGKLWVNVDGVCAMRIGYVAELDLETLDNRGGRINRQAGTIKYPPNELALAAQRMESVKAHVARKIDETADEQSEALRITKRMMADLPPAPKYTPEQQRAMHAPPPGIDPKNPLPPGDQYIVQNLRRTHGERIAKFDDYTIAKTYRNWQLSSDAAEESTFPDWLFHGIGLD